MNTLPGQDLKESGETIKYIFLSKYYQATGKGKFTYPNREYYEGDFVNGMKSGVGTYYFSDGSQYVGKNHFLQIN